VAIGGAEGFRAARNWIDTKLLEEELIMKIIAVTAAAVICLAGGTARGADRNAERGPYAGIGGGITGADRNDGSTVDTFSHQRGGALKLFAGYQIDRHFGVEGGYLRTGHFSQTLTIGAEQVSQSVKTHAWYAAGTARLPLGTGFALTGTVGAAFAKVNGQDTVSGSQSLLGGNTSVLAGVGAQYRMSDRTTLQLDLTGIDEMSHNLSVGAITLSIRKRF
jgi:hypothetical protein